MVQRISVVGSSGSVKTKTSRAIAEKLGYPRLEVDGVHHLPEWNDLDFVRLCSCSDVEAFVDSLRWRRPSPVSGS